MPTVHVTVTPPADPAPADAYRAALVAACWDPEDADYLAGLLAAGRPNKFRIDFDLNRLVALSRAVQEMPALAVEVTGDLSPAIAQLRNAAAALEYVRSRQ